MRSQCGGFPRIVSHSDNQWRGWLQLHHREHDSFKKHDFLGHDDKLDFDRTDPALGGYQYGRFAARKSVSVLSGFAWEVAGR